MFVVRVQYKAPLEEVDKYLKAHREFLEEYYRKGVLVASGPCKPREGGIIIALGEDKQEIRSMLNKDPFHLAEIADYEIIEFSPMKHCDAIKPLLQEKEGALCLS